jgi:hypothetical protein
MLHEDGAFVRVGPAQRRLPPPAPSEEGDPAPADGLGQEPTKSST